MKVVAFAIAPVMMHRRHDWNTTAYAFRHRALQRGLPWKRRGRHDGFSMTSSVGSKAQEPYTAYLVQANTDRTSFTYVLSFFFFSSCCETAKHRRVKSDLRWNSWKKLEKDFKDFERMFRECINILYTLHCVNLDVSSGIWKIISSLLEKRRIIDNLSRYWNEFSRKYTRFIGIPAIIFLLF